MKKYVFNAKFAENGWPVAGAGTVAVAVAVAFRSKQFNSFNPANFLNPKLLVKGAVASTAPPQSTQKTNHPILQHLSFRTLAELGQKSSHPHNDASRR